MVDLPIPATAENVALARAFLFEKWLERHNERYPSLPALRPIDLSGSCIFSATFAQRIFGGELRGSKQHVFTRLCGKILDLNAEALDVKEMIDPYRHRTRELRTRDFREALQSCQPRVEQWVAQFNTRLSSRAQHPASIPSGKE